MANYSEEGTQIANRIKKADFKQKQGPAAKCLLCQKKWEDCEHSIVEVSAVAQIIFDDDIREKWGLVNGRD